MLNRVFNFIPQISQLEQNLSLLDRIRAIAAEGLFYAKDKFDQERYEKLIDIAVSEYGKIINLPNTQVKSLITKDLGCVTPKIGVDVVVLNKRGECLLLERKTEQNSTWCFPGGFIDLAESPLRTAEREVKEETGLDVEALGYLAVTHKGPHMYENVYHQISLLVVTMPVKNNAKVELSHEHMDYKWYGGEGKINWYGGHERFPEIVQDYLKNKKFISHKE